MAVPAIDATTGHLDVGRHGATLDELKARFVDAPEYAQSMTRRSIWSDFESATAGLRGRLPVAWVWISGSFISTKLDPDDIDVIYWCEDVNLDSVSDLRDKFMIELFATNALRATFNLRVDSRIGRWHIRPEPGIQDTTEHHNYAKQRGFWDDFWLRRRSGPKGSPAVREDALARRGYVEVFLDGGA
mgnify:CR=1 FL=1